VSTSFSWMRGERFTDDHQADIRGLGTAFHCVRPELPLSSSRGLERGSYRISQARILLSQLSSHSFFFLSSVLVTRRCFHNVLIPTIADIDSD
jgi:hypothetical protein